MYLIILTRAEVSSLYNEPLHYTVDGCALVVQWFERALALSPLSRTQTAEVLRCLGNDITI